MATNSIPAGMATDAQLAKIRELTAPQAFKIPLSSFLKNITGGIAGSIDELTSVQAKDVLGVLKKLKK